MNMMIFSVAVSALVFPIIGKCCDMVDPKKTVPFAFFFRAMTTYLFSTLDSPDSIRSYGVCVLMILSSIIENISVDSIFNKNLPKETRGVLMGLYSCAGQFGILCFSLIAGSLFDNVGAHSPFVFLGILDFMFALITIAFGFKYDFSSQ
jgi:MFS family permease